MSELLHTLSVSPEKRAALRQHMALRSTMERDRSASGLGPSEDAAIWGSIASVIQTPAGAGISAGAAVASRIPGWFIRSAAVFVVGVAGYLLGSNETTNIFRGEDSRPTVAVNARASAGSARTAAPSSVGATTPSQSSSASVPAVVAPAPVALATRSGSTQSIVTRSATSMQSHSTVRQTATRHRHASEQMLASEQTLKTETITQNDRTNHDRSDGNTPPVTPVAVLDNHSATLSTAAQAYDAMVAQATTAVDSKPLPQVPVMPLAMKHANTSTVAPEAAPFYANGLEVAFGERVGMITPTPTGVDEADPEYSNRSLDVSYRFMDGQIGIGARLTYGTFSTVGLEARPVSDLGMDLYTPKLEAKKGLEPEFFVNYRLPLLDRLGIGIEASFFGTSTFQKVGGDLFLLWFVNDHIGIQAGGGYGVYRYNLRDQRDQLFRDNPNAAISSDALESYQGTMLQGRYGLLYRF
jgi:hypothetical protein